MAGRPVAVPLLAPSHVSPPSAQKDAAAAPAPQPIGRAAPATGWARLAVRPDRPRLSRRYGAGPLRPDRPAQALVDLPRFVPALAPLASGSASTPHPSAVHHPRSKGEPAAHRSAARYAEEPPILETPGQGGSLATGAAAHGGGSAGSGLIALVTPFIFLSPGPTQWLRVGTERRPRLLRAGRRERPG
jgi:hypothetical protein